MQSTTDKSQAGQRTLYKTRDRCAVCDGWLNALGDEVVSFERVPLANGFDQPNVQLPMRLDLCSRCGHFQLRESVNPDVLFGNYAYRAGTNDMQKRQFAELAREVRAFFGERLNEKHAVYDIGANDGSLLKEFPECEQWGIDPNLGDGVSGFKCFLNEAELPPQTGKVILATNTWAHIADLQEATRRVAKCLRDDGVFVIQVPWARDLILNNQYDTLYHEHQHWFTVRALRRLYEQHDLAIARLDYLPELHGGTIRVWATKSTTKGGDAAVDLFELLEEPIYGVDFAEQIEVHAAILRTYMDGNVEAFGASAKGVMLMNLADLPINACYDDTPTKICKWLPGKPTCYIRDARTASLSRADTILITAWNYADSIASRLLVAGYDGKLLVPFPVPRFL